MKRKGKQQKVIPRVLDNISASFDCSGTFELKQPLKIFYLTEQQNGVISFPKPKQDEIQNAVKYAKKSGFGKGSQNVMDQQYRLAFQYLPQQLGLSSLLTQTITQDITEAISLNLASKQLVRAQLVKLNIYPKGGLFQSHVDSPKGDAFGSLVIFLPCYFEGGDLTIQHNKQKHIFSYGNGSKQSVYINWVAFYNDCVHQVAQVTNGYRLTLSYNLHYVKAPKIQVFPREDVIKILAELNNSKLYGYYCEHYYGNNALKNASQSGQRLLKGKDYELYNASRAIGIKSQIQVFYKLDNIYYFQQQETKVFIGPPEKVCQIKMGQFYSQGYNSNPYQRMVEVYGAKQLKLEEVTWLNNPKDFSKYTYAINGYYGNDYSLNQSYCELIILLAT